VVARDGHNFWFRERESYGLELWPWVMALWEVERVRVRVREWIN